MNKSLPERFTTVVFTIGIFTVAVFLCGTCTANQEDYVAYAKQQEQKAKKIIAPYKAEIDEIVKNVSARQLQPDIQAFKKEVTELAKTQCSMNRQGNTSAAAYIEQVAAQVPIVVFVSFSMPKESIKGWIAQAKKIGAAVYIRGLVNNSFRDTTKAVRELVQDQSGGLLIDPTLFKKYAITQVPAVVVAGSNNFDVIYGDATLDYALEKMSRAVQISEQQSLLDAIKKLRDKKPTS